MIEDPWVSVGAPRTGHERHRNDTHETRYVDTRARTPRTLLSGHRDLTTDHGESDATRAVQHRALLGSMRGQAQLN